jgi:hypothetical protein
MITFRSPHIQNPDLPHWSSIRHGAARANARSTSQLAHQSALRKAESYARNRLFMRGNIFGQRTYHCRLPLRSFCCAQIP